MEFYKPNLLRRSTSLSSVILKYFLVTVRLTWLRLSYRDRHYNIKFYCDGKIFFMGKIPTHIGILTLNYLHSIKESKLLGDSQSDSVLT